MFQYYLTTTTRSQSKKAPEHSGGLEGDWNVSTYINFKTDLRKKKTGTVRRGGGGPTPLNKMNLPFREMSKLTYGLVEGRKYAKRT